MFDFWKQLGILLLMVIFISLVQCWAQNDFSTVSASAHIHDRIVQTNWLAGG